MPRDPGVLLETGFEEGCEGRLLCVRFVPHDARATVIYVHPFAEELNKSRHVVAHAARELAAAGVMVELVDLFGCGDSEGSLENATVQAWLSDIERRCTVARSRVNGPVHLWGLRLGALLAATAHCREHSMAEAAKLVMWQPVTRGRQVVTEFLRLRAAASLMAGDGDRETADTLRKRLADGETLEVAGYRLTPQLAGGLDALSLKDCHFGSRPLHWLDVSRSPESALSPAIQGLMDGWRAEKTPVAITRIAGPSFWNAGELEDCPELARPTVDALSSVSE